MHHVGLFNSAGATAVKAWACIYFSILFAIVEAVPRATQLFSTTQINLQDQWEVCTNPLTVLGAQHFPGVLSKWCSQHGAQKPTLDPREHFGFTPVPCAPSTGHLAQFFALVSFYFFKHLIVLFIQPDWNLCRKRVGLLESLTNFLAPFWSKHYPLAGG